MPAIYPYTVTNSYKGGFFMRTYGRNVRRAWDGDDYRAPKRQRLEHATQNHAVFPGHSSNNENVSYAYDLEDTLERAIRETSVAALSSSPSRKNSTVFSLNESHEEDSERATAITPPSSPPPALLITPPVVKARKPTFSFLDKKKQKEKEKLKHAKRKIEYVSDRTADVHMRDESEPLSEIVNASTRVASQSVESRPLAQAQAKTPTLQKQMTQTVLDFGQSLTPITCKECDMSYTPSVAEDDQLHKMYHSRNSQGIELGKPFLKSAMKWCYEVPHIEGSVVVVDRKISLPGRRVVQRVLEVVNKELGSIDITEADLWSQRALEGDDNESGADENAKKVDRYKVFLHVVNEKCVGVCLAERIAKAYKVHGANVIARSSPPAEQDQASANAVNGTKQDQSKDTNKPEDSIPTPTSSTSPIFTSQSSSLPTNPEQPSTSNSFSPADLTLESASTAATVGVSRIWTSAYFRRAGIANNLLECVMNQFIYGVEIGKDDVAFSTPTESGVRLARGWYGGETGWRVYHEM